MPRAHEGLVTHLCPPRRAPSISLCSHAPIYCYFHQDAHTRKLGKLYKPSIHSSKPTPRPRAFLPRHDSRMTEIIIMTVRHVIHLALLYANKCFSSIVEFFLSEHQTAVASGPLANGRVVGGVLVALCPDAHDLCGVHGVRRGRRGVPWCRGSRKEPPMSRTAPATMKGRGTLHSWAGRTKGGGDETRTDPPYLLGQHDTPHESRQGSNLSAISLVSIGAL